MKATLQRLAARYDAASMRERILLFAAAALVIAFLAYATFLEPQRAKQRRLSADLARSQAELAALRTGLEGMARKAAADPDAALQARLAAARAQLARINAGIVEQQRRFTPPERMRSVLAQILRSHSKLTLVDLRTLPPVALGEAKPSAGALYRHGMELTLSGTYAELYDYLRALESLPTQLYWGRAELVVAEHPAATLKLTVFTISGDRAWLVV